jgi:ABC-type uncharacterized transport system substrate-binding protein
MIPMIQDVPGRTLRAEVKPSVAPDEFAALGGLMSYGINLKDQYRNVGRILKGTKPADLPVMQPTKFEMVINTKIAKELNLMVSATLLAQADELIE